MYLTTNAAFLHNINDALTTLGKNLLNYELFIYDANFNGDAYISQVTTLADQGTDGFIIGSDEGSMERILEVCSETGCPFVGNLTPLVNPDGSIAMGSVSMDDVKSGTMMMQWLIDNYKSYWKEPFDPAKLGCIGLPNSVISGIHIREKTISGVFSKAFPESAQNYYIGDLVTLENGFSAEGGQQMAAALMSSHADVEKWFVIGLVDDWSMGAARAAESLNKQDDTLIVSHQNDAFTKEMQSGIEKSCYVAANAISPNEIAAAEASYLITILEGRATAETIWPEWVPTGSKYPDLVVKGTMVTKDTYQQWIKDTSLETLTAGMTPGK
jgi:ABC-type sugar transport system substrate-binding protein